MRIVPYRNDKLIKVLECDEETVTLQELEYCYIWVALKRNDFLRMPTAKQLGMSIRSLRNKIHLLRLCGFEVPESPHGTPYRSLRSSGKFFSSGEA